MEKSTDFPAVSILTANVKSDEMEMSDIYFVKKIRTFSKSAKKKLLTQLLDWDTP